MPSQIRQVTVIGTGTLGTQIAVQVACFDYQVIAYDPDAASFPRTLENLMNFLETSEKRPCVSLAEWRQAADRVQLVPDLEAALQEADLVIEAVPENLEIKREMFARIDTLAPSRALLATNSSSIPISWIEEATQRPEQCLNLHFYQPGLGINMVDVMGGRQTTSEALETARNWVRSIACVPLTVKKELLGFCFNRVWRAVKREVLSMWAEGCVDFQDIDRAWMIFSGMSLGPFGMMDTVGLDVISDIEKIYYRESQDPRDYPPAALQDLIDRGELGVKAAQGFYSYPDPEYQDPDFLKP